MFVQKVLTTTIILDEGEAETMRRILNVQLEQGDFRDDYLAGEILSELRGLATPKGEGREEKADEQPTRWFRDDDGDYWRENPDGTLTVAWVNDDGGGYTDSETFRKLNMEFAEARFGPLRECEAPQS